MRLEVVMLKVKALRPHTVKGVVVARGFEYDEVDRLVHEKVRAGLVELVGVRAKVASEMYAPRVTAPVAPAVDEPVRFVSRSGNWYFFSDGEKVLGRKAALDKLGVDDVDFDNQ
jgi:hypothetical protein